MWYYLNEQINEIVDWLSEEGHTVRVITGIPNYPSGKYYKGYSLKSQDLFTNILHRIFRDNLIGSLVISRSYRIFT